MYVYCNLIVPAAPVSPSPVPTLFSSKYIPNITGPATAFVFTHPAPHTACSGYGTGITRAVLPPFSARNLRGRHRSCLATLSSQHTICPPAMKIPPLACCFARASAFQRAAQSSRRRVLPPLLAGRECTHARSAFFRLTLLYTRRGCWNGLGLYAGAIPASGCVWTFWHAEARRWTVNTYECDGLLPSTPFQDSCLENSLRAGCGARPISSSTSMVAVQGSALSCRPKRLQLAEAASEGSACRHDMQRFRCSAATLSHSPALGFSSTFKLCTQVDRCPASAERRPLCRLDE